MAKEQEATKRYKVLVGMNYGVDSKIRREPGDVVSDLPVRSVRALLDQGDIEPYDDNGGE